MKTAKLPLEEIVFENRNKEYGAYDLRKSYPKYISKAFMYAISSVLLLLLAPMIYKQLYPESAKEITNIIQCYGLTKPPVIETPILEIPKPTMPAPKLDLPKTASTKFAVLEPEPDDLLQNTEEPTHNTDIKGMIAQTTQAGIEDSHQVEIIDIAETNGNTIIDEKDELPVLFVEQMPTFAGGMEELGKFLSKNLRYPRQASNEGIEGKVYLQFVVDKNGKVSQITVLKGIGFGCDEEAIRVVAMMPTWTAGKQSGKPVAVRYTLPIVFKLNR
jgi:protein TonB